MANSEKLDLVMSIPFLIQGEASEGTVRLQVYVLRQCCIPSSFAQGFWSLLWHWLPGWSYIHCHDILCAI